MNEKIETFLSKYTYEDDNGFFWGSFANQRILQNVRDQLTHQDWLDIFANIKPGYKHLPPNLQKSLKQKFEEMEEWQIDNKCEYKSPAQLYNMYKDTTKKRRVQTLIWGVVTSSIETEYFRRAAAQPIQTNKWSPFK